MKLRNFLKAFKILPLITTLRKMKSWTPQSIVDFSLNNSLLGTLQVPSEIHRFAEIVADLKPRTFMEIGTCHGGTLCILSRLTGPNGTIISLDLPDGEFGGSYKWFHIPIFKAFPYAKQKLHLLRGDSHSQEMGNAVRKILHEKKLDLLFIDGDHTYEGVKKDFEDYSGLVRPGGIIAFHDIVQHPSDHCDVHRLWQELKSKYRHEEIVESYSQNWAGIGVLYT